jgi:hypothetical protein
MGSGSSDSEGRQSENEGVYDGKENAIRNRQKKAWRGMPVPHGYE